MNFKYQKQYESTACSIYFLCFSSSFSEVLLLKVLNTIDFGLQDFLTSFFGEQREIFS